MEINGLKEIARASRECLPRHAGAYAQRNFEIFYDTADHEAWHTEHVSMNNWTQLREGSDSIYCGRIFSVHTEAYLKEMVEIAIQDHIESGYLTENAEFPVEEELE